MRSIAAAITGIVLVVLSAGCNLTIDVSPADSLASQYYQALMAKDFDKAKTFYSDDFFKAGALTEQEWQEVWPRIQVKLGDLWGYKLTKWSIMSTSSGVQYDLFYDVQYASYQAIERFLITRPAGGSDKELKIRRHDINSTGLLR